MKYRLVVAPRAERDVQVIFNWIAERRPQGAARWYEAFSAALESLRINSQRCGIADESPLRDQEIRQHFFRTRKGHKYRLIFSIRAEEVHILHVRGYGQRAVSPDDF